MNSSRVPVSCLLTVMPFGEVVVELPAGDFAEAPALQPGDHLVCRGAEGVLVAHLSGQAASGVHLLADVWGQVAGPAASCYCVVCYELFQRGLFGGHSYVNGGRATFSPV